MRLGLKGDKGFKEKMLRPSNLWQNEEKCARHLEATPSGSSFPPADPLYIPPLQSEQELAVSWPTLNSLTSFLTCTFPLSKNDTPSPIPTTQHIQMQCNFLGSTHLLPSPLSLFRPLQPPDSWSACSLSSFTIHFWCGNYSCYYRTIMCILQCSVAIWRKKVVISSGQKKEAGVELSYFLPIWF